MAESQCSLTRAFIAPSQSSCFVAKNSGSPRSGNIAEDLLHLGACESAQSLRADIAQHVGRQQDAGRRFVVRASKTHTWSLLTQRPVHLLDTNSHRLHLRGPVGYPLSRFLGGANTFVGELH
jgi:hypothetical protein